MCFCFYIVACGTSVCIPHLKQTTATVFILYHVHKSSTFFATFLIAYFGMGVTITITYMYDKIGLPFLSVT